jgi:hypothetical protein
MSQISPPIRILLAVVVALAAVWFLFLRPGEPEPVPTTAAPTPTPAAQTTSDQATAQTGAGAAVQSARDAAAKVTGQADEQTGTQAATSATASGAAVPDLDAAAIAHLPRDVARGLRTRKVIVLGVLDTVSQPWRPMPDDDRLVRRSLKDLDERGGDVVVKQVSVADLSSYGPLTRTVDVSQSPTVVVVDRNRRAVSLAGYLDRVSIEQAVTDALRASSYPRIPSRYLRRVNHLCASSEFRWRFYSAPVVRGSSRLRLRQGERLVRSYRRSFARLDAPRRYRALERRTVHFLDVEARLMKRLRAAVNSKRSSRIEAAFAAVNSRADEARSLSRAFAKAGVTSCDTRNSR